MSLHHALFRIDPRIREAATVGPALMRGERSHAVTLLQAALIMAGYPLLHSISAKTGAPDGAYGPETEKMVHKFQLNNFLRTDGKAGRHTLHALDALLSSGPTVTTKPPPMPPPAAPPPAPTTSYLTDPFFKVGSDDPVPHFDIGSGPWNVNPKTWMIRAEYYGIWAILAPAAGYVGIDAAKNMEHFLANSGEDHQIDLEKMVKDVPSAQALFETHKTNLRTFCELLPQGRFPVVARRLLQGYNTEAESRNWYYAIGGYSTWIKATVDVIGTGAGRDILADCEYKFADRYNWDHGKSVDLPLPNGKKKHIQDIQMQEFHRQGFAQEYNNYGTFAFNLRWRVP